MDSAYIITASSPCFAAILWLLSMVFAAEVVALDSARPSSALLALLLCTTT